MARLPRVLALTLLTLAPIACGDDAVDAAPDGGIAEVSGDAAAGPLTIASPTTLDGLTVGTPATPIAFTATGAAPVTWSIQGGSLPPGMTLDVSTGAYAGTPTVHGSYSFTIAATNGGETVTKAYTQEVAVPAPDAHLLLANNQLVALAVDYPSVVTSPVTVGGVAAGETLVAIARRPQTGMLHALGVDGTANTLSLYAIATATGFATRVGDGGHALGGVNLPSSGYTMDVNPQVDRIRVVTTSGLNFRLTPSTGAPVDGDGNDNNGITPDGAIGGAVSVLSGVAFTNNVVNTAITTAYGIDATTSKLVILSAANAGTTSNAVPLSSMVTAVRGFDIPAGANAPASNEPANGDGYAIVLVGGQAADALVRVNLATGQLSAPIPVPASGIRSLAIQRQPAVPIVALQAGGGSLLRFYGNATATATNVPLSGVAGGEKLVGIDFRPSTGQLYGLGVNAGGNTATLYLVDPQSGNVTPAGATSAIAFVDGAGNAVDFPDPDTTAYAVDFNPSVDRLRVVTASGLNFRVNPNNGAALDGNLGGASAVNGTNPDGALNGGATGLAGLAHTNDPGPLTTTPTTPTTLFGLDPQTDALLRFATPNSGTLTNALVVKAGGVQLDFTAAAFDIPTLVRVPGENAAPTAGIGYAALAVGGVTHLYVIDLVTAAATDLGTIGAGNPLAGIAVGTVAP